MARARSALSPATHSHRFNDRLFPANRGPPINACYVTRVTHWILIKPRVNNRRVTNIAEHSAGRWWAHVTIKHWRLSRKFRENGWSITPPNTGWATLTQNHNFWRSPGLWIQNFEGSWLESRRLDGWEKMCISGRSSEHVSGIYNLLDGHEFCCNWALSDWSIMLSAFW